MVRVPSFTVEYAGVDISESIKPFLVGIVYTDKLEGESDELEIDLKNDDLRWMGTWFPGEGDRVTLTLGYENEASLGPIGFEVDEPEFNGPPDRASIKGLATPISSSLRQRNTAAYESTTLRAIAQQIAERHGLQLVGEVPAIRLDRVSQKEESDLEFLKKLAADYGLIFKIESTTRLVFYRESELESAPAVMALERRQAPEQSDFTSYRLRKGTAGTYKACEVRYMNPGSGELISVTVDASGAEVTGGDQANDASGADIATGDTLKIREYCENREQALIRAQEGLRRANRGQVEGSLEMEGNVAIAAGINIDLVGFLQLDGKYQVSQVRHLYIKRQGYRSSIEIKRIEPAAGPQQ